MSLLTFEGYAFSMCVQEGVANIEGDSEGRRTDISDCSSGCIIVLELSVSRRRVQVPTTASTGMLQVCWKNIRVRLIKKKPRLLNPDEKQNMGSEDREILITSSS